jgi:hypothetical protein
MNWEKFNNRLRKDAEGQNNDVDIDSIWNAIEPQVDEINNAKNKKRRGVFFWWGAVVLLFSVGLCFLGNQFSPKENFAQHTDNQEITPEVKTTTIEHEVNSAIKIPTTPQDDLGKNGSDNQSDFQKNNDITVTNSESDFSKNKNRATENKSNSNPPSSTSSNVVLVNKIPTATLSSTVISGNTNEHKNKNPSFQNPPTPANQSRNKEEILAISSLPNLLNFSAEKFSLTEVKKVWFPIPKKENRFSVGIYGGANFTKRNLATKNAAVNILLRNRENYETPLETSQVGFNFSYKILHKEKYNVEITTGLQLTSIAERYKNFNSTITEKQVDGVEFLSYGLGTTPTEIMGLITQTKTTEYKKEIYNTYRMVDIPVLISYNRSFGEKWQVGIQGGIFANLSLKTEGIIPTATLTDFYLSNNNGEEIFKSNIGLSYHLGLNFKRKLSQHWELNFSPAVRYFGNDFANDNYGLSQKYILFGGNIGVNYNFYPPHLKGSFGFPFN